MDMMIVARQMLVVLILMLVGVVCQKVSRVEEKQQKFLSWLVVNVFNPALTLSSVMGQTGERKRIYILYAFVISAVMFAVLILIGKIFAFFIKDAKDKVIWQMMIIFSNLGFIGIPVVRGILGSEYVIYVACFMLEFNLLIYSYGIGMMRKAERQNPAGTAQQHERQKNAGNVTERVKETKGFLAALRPMANIGTFAGILAILLFLLDVRVPYVISQSMEYLGNVAVPLPLMITGMTLARQEEVKSLFGDVRMYLFIAFKMILLPSAGGLLLKMLPLPEDIRLLSLIMFAMPVGNMTLMLLSDHGWPEEECSKGIILSTILSVATLPVVTWIYQAL